MEIKQYLFTNSALDCEVEVKGMTLAGALLEANAKLQKMGIMDFRFLLTDGMEVHLYFFENKTYGHQVIGRGHNKQNALEYANKHVVQKDDDLFQFRIAEGVHFGFCMTILNEHVTSFKTATGIYRDNQLVVAIQKQEDFTTFFFSPDTHERHLRFFWERQMVEYDCSVGRQKTIEFPEQILTDRKDELCKPVSGVNVKVIRASKLNSFLDNTTSPSTPSTYEWK